MKVRLIIAGIALLVATATAVILLPVAIPPHPARGPGPRRPSPHQARGPGHQPPSPHLAMRTQRGFPRSSDTGVPGGARLRRVPGQVSHGKGWRFDPRGWVDVYGKHAVLRNLYIPYNLSVKASNVVIANVRVVNGGPDAIGISLRHTRHVTIANSTISGRNTGRGRMMTGIKDIFGDSTGLRVLGDDISRFETGIQVEAGLIAGNYIHNAGYIHGDHTNGIMSNGGGRRLLTVTHNTILIKRGQTDAIGLFEDFGVQRNRHITHNLLAGGGYAIYAGQKRSGPRTSNIKVVGNVISTVYFARGGHYGCAVHYNRHGAGNVWARNRRGRGLCHG